MTSDLVIFFVYVLFCCNMGELSLVNVGFICTVVEYRKNNNDDNEKKKGNENILMRSKAKLDRPLSHFFNSFEFSLALTAYFFLTTT